MAPAMRLANDEGKQSMEFEKHPVGDVYDIKICVQGPIVIPFGVEAFSVPIVVKNCSDVAWDTSDRLRLASWMVEPEPKYKDTPHYLVERRDDFPSQSVFPHTETEFRINLNVNLIPKGSYLLYFDLVVEQKYMLASSGGRRQSCQVDIVDKTAAGVVFYPNVTAPAVPLRRPGRADLSVGSPTSAFRLIENAGSHQLADPTADGARLEHHVAWKKVIVRFDWWQHFFRHYAHFLEFIICLYSICREYAGEVDELIILIGDNEFTTGSNPDVQRFLLDSLFKNWKVLPWLEDGEFSDALFVIDFNGRRQKTPINRIIVDHIDLVTDALASFKARCLGNIPSLSRRPDRKTAVYAKRGGSRSMSADAERLLLSIFSDFGYDIVDVDFGKVTMFEQINIACNASVIFGVHGNNLTNCVWLPKGAALVEIFPAGFHGTDFQILCEIAGAHYLGVEAKELGFVYRDFSRLPGCTHLGEPYDTPQHHQDAIAYIPERVVKAFLRKIP